MYFHACKCREASLCYQSRVASSGFRGITRGFSARRFENPLVRGSRSLSAAWGPPSRWAVPLGGNGKRGEIPLNTPRAWPRWSDRFFACRSTCARDVSPDPAKRHFSPSPRPPLQPAHKNPQRSPQAPDALRMGRDWPLKPTNHPESLHPRVSEQRTIIAVKREFR
jgi:hypothetical protein